MSGEVFDEQLSLRRLFVPLKRADWRMFEQGLEKLRIAVEGGHPFKRHQDWQAFFKIAEADAELPEPLKAQLREAMTRLLAVEVSIPAASAEAAESGEAIALVAGWHSSLREPQRLAAFKRWLAGPTGGASTGRRLIEGWLAEPGVTLETLVNRANLTLAAGYGGLATSEPPWIDTFMAGLAYALAPGTAQPPFTKLVEALAPVGPVSVVTAEPSMLWEQFYAGAGVRFARSADDESAAAGAIPLAKLAGSLDGFYCHACHRYTLAGPGALQALAVACPHCAAPAWPLVVPVDNPHFLPPPVRNTWAWAGELLREARTWVLVEPPAPQDGALQAWLASSLSEAHRVLVLGASDAALAAWREWLEARGVSAVTSHGPADDVAGFLLQGGVPALKAEPVRGPVATGKKKHRR